MAKFRKKPVVIDAIRWNGESDLTPVKEWFESFGPDEWSGNTITGAKFEIVTLEGNHTVTPTDYIIRGVKGEYYPCKADIFNMTYEPVNIPINQ